MARLARRPVPRSVDLVGGLATFWPAVVYPAAILAGAAAFAVASQGQREAWIGYASTNLDNLGGHPVRALVLSGLVVEGDVAAWVVLAALGLAGVARAGGAWWAIGVGAGGHLLGTAVSEGLLGVRMARGLAPIAQRHIVDVGPSFVVVATLVTTVLACPHLWWRVAAALGFGLLTPSLFDGLSSGDVAAVGHCVSIAVGLAAAAVLRGRERRARTAAPAPSELTAP